MKFKYIIENKIYSQKSQSLIISLNLPEEKVIEIIKNKSKGEFTSLLQFAIGMIFGGIHAFTTKYLQYIFPNEYDIYSLLFWRSFFLIPMSFSLIVIKKIEIIPIWKVKNKICLIVRSLGMYLGLLTYIHSLQYIRMSTSNCITSMNPALIVLLGVFLINEKFHMRYIYGIIICFSGTLLIILNERKFVEEENAYNLSNQNHIQSEINTIKTSFEILYGYIFAILNLIISAFTSLSTKILNDENFGFENQIFYIGVSNSLFVIIFSNFIGANVGILFIIYCFVMVTIPNFIFTVLTIEALKGVDISKTVPLNYLLLLTVFILGVLFLNEPIYITDIIGSLIILTYNIFNLIFPL